MSVNYHSHFTESTIYPLIFDNIAPPAFFTNASIPAIVAIAPIIDTNCMYSVPGFVASCAITGVTITKDVNAPIITDAAIFFGCGGLFDFIQPRTLCIPTPAITIRIDRTMGWKPKISSMNQLQISD